MDAVATENTGIAVDAALAERIVTVSDAAPQRYPDAASSETVEIMMRREAEEHFQRALSRRTWWRLTEQERDALRAAIIARDPLYTRRDSPWLESACCKEILHVLESAHDRTQSFGVAHHHC